MTKINLSDYIFNELKLQRRKSGTYYFQPKFILPNGEKTKAKTFSSSLKNEIEAYPDLLTQLETYILQGKHFELSGLSNSKNPLFKDFYKTWYNKKFHSEYTNSRAREEIGYKFTYILEKLGNQPLKNIRYSELEDFYNGLITFDTNGKKRDKPLSSNSVRKYSTPLLKIFDYAVNLELVEFNPIRNFELSQPASRKKKLLEEKKVDSFKPVETKIILEEAFKVNHQWGTLVYLALMTGLRRGEIIALDINSSLFLDENRILVDKEIVTSGEKRLELTTPKNGKSRNIYFNDELKYLIKKQIENRLAFNEKQGDKINWSVTFPLFVPESRNLNGQPYAPHSLSQKWKNFMCNKVIPKHPDVRYFNLHILRHTFGTTLLNNMMPLELVSQALGHSSISITEKYYVHPSDDRIKNTFAYLPYKLPESELEFIKNSKEKEDSSS